MGMWPSAWKVAPWRTSASISVDVPAPHWPTTTIPHPCHETIPPEISTAPRSCATMPSAPERRDRMPLKWHDVVLTVVRGIHCWSVPPSRREHFGPRLIQERTPPAEGAVGDHVHVAP